MEEEREEEIEPRSLFGEHTKRDTPPFGERKEGLAPIIFRTKNIEKSRLGLIGKNFGKNLWENVSGEKESPQS